MTHYDSVPPLDGDDIFFTILTCQISPIVLERPGMLLDTSQAQLSGLVAQSRIPRQDRSLLSLEEQSLLCLRDLGLLLSSQ